MDSPTEQARAILTTNDRGGHTVPTQGLYPYQWNWDSAFAALGFAAFDLDRAWREIETLMAGQWDSGMVPHILFHRRDDGYFPGPEVWQGRGPIPSSGVTQPPVALSVAARLYRQDPGVGAARMRALYPGLRRWAEWLLRWRTDAQGAVFVTHPWESGRDNAPCWDEAMASIDPLGVGPYQRRDTQHVDATMRPTEAEYDRYIWLVQRGARLEWDDAAMAKAAPFQVADPTLTFTLLRGLRDLADVGAELALDTGGLPEAIARLDAGAESLWNGSHYDSRTLGGGWARALTNASYLCWWAGIDRPEMRAHLDRMLDACPYGVPSLDEADARFDAKRYWRGPTWGMMNLMVGEGLTAHGHPQGETLRQRTQALIRDNGFSEYFDPLTGAPAGGGAFTWTAAIWLAWAGRA